MFLLNVQGCYGFANGEGGDWKIESGSTGQQGTYVTGAYMCRNVPVILMHSSQKMRKWNKIKKILRC